MLNSAHTVILPMRSFVSRATLSLPPEKLSPSVPPMMLNPLICSMTSGNVAKSKATFVNVPVATSHAVSLG